MAPIKEEALLNREEEERRWSFTTGQQDSASRPSPLLHSASSFEADLTHKTNTTFIQDQLSSQRSPSVAKEQATALSTQLAKKLYDSQESSPSEINVRHDAANSGQLNRHSDRDDPVSSLVDGANECTLSKSSSERSGRSGRSERSVRSLHAVGNYPYGSLQIHSPSPTRKDKSETHQCLKSGDVFILRDVPAGSLLGYDTKAFAVRKDSQFDGIKYIPPGAHFVWGGSGEASLRTGFWLMSVKLATGDFGEIHVRRWDNHLEVIQQEISAAELRIQKDGLPEIFDQLHSYDLSTVQSTPAVGSDPTADEIAVPQDSNTWGNLTSSIKGALLTKITGHEWNKWQVSSTHDIKSSAELGSSSSDIALSLGQNEYFHFVFPKDVRTFTTSVIGRDRTEQAMDTTMHVGAVIRGRCTYEEPDEIIGEVQFCFLTGMFLGNIACMEQWAHIIKILFKAFRLALDCPKFFRNFIQAFHRQLIYDEVGLEGSIFDHDSSLREELRLNLTTFKSRLNESLLARGTKLTAEEKEVGRAFEELESWLWRWGWDLKGDYVRRGKVQLEDGEIVDAELKEFEAEDERGEFAPAVVELDEDGREKGLFSL